MKNIHDNSFNNIVNKPNKIIISNMNNGVSFNKHIDSLSTYYHKLITVPIIKKNTSKKFNNIMLIGFNYKQLLLFKYKNNDLKKLCKSYGIRRNGNKNELLIRLYNYIKWNKYSIIIQKIYRGFLVRYLNKLKHITIKDKCVNNTDFLTLCNISNIPYNQIIYINDKNCTFGYDICSLYQLIIKNKYKNNPYTRRKFKSNIKYDLERIIRISNMLGLGTNIKLKDDLTNISKKKKIELETIRLFQLMDNKGFITDINWFLSLNKIKLIKYLKELMDIWNYRAQLSDNIKKLICPPNGMLLDNIGNINTPNSLISRDITSLQQYVLNIINKLITKSNDEQYRYLGMTYVLGALTLVNTNTANALAWLYYGFMGNNN